MKRIIALALLGITFSASTFAEPIVFRLSAQTDGNRYGYQIDGAGNYTDTSEYGVGIATLNETVDFSFDIQGTDNRTIEYPSGYVFHEMITLFTPGQLPVANGLLAPGLNPSFTPDSEALYPNGSGSMYWTSHSSGSGGVGGLLFQIGIGWVATLTDEWGAFHQFTYTRSYDIMNNTMLSSPEDLVVFTEALFQQLVADPNTQYSFNETVHEMIFGCTQPELCGSNGQWSYSVSGTFALEQIGAVPTPGALGLIALGSFLLAFRLPWKKKRG